MASIIKYMVNIYLAGVTNRPLFLKVSRLESGAKGGGSRSRAENSPYVLSQMLAAFEMLLAGILLGFVSLLAEIKRGKKKIVRSSTRSARSKRSRPSRSIGTPEATVTSPNRAEPDPHLKRSNIQKMVRFDSKFEDMVGIEM